MLEVCVDSVASALAAEAGGADRLEVNCGLELGGLTPSLGLLRELNDACSVPIVAMVRPRGAGFCYSIREQQVMLRDMDSLLSLGVAGIVCGALKSPEQVDETFWLQAVRIVGDRELIFHRALDLIDDWQTALKTLLDCGCTRVLTSGGAATAIDGVARLEAMQQEFGVKLEILPAAGIKSSNVSNLLHATGCTQVHGSFSSQHYDAAAFVAPSEFAQTDTEHVRAVRAVLDQMAG